MNTSSDAELIQRERAWHRKSTTWIWIAGAATGVVTTPLVIGFMRTHSRWTDTELFLAILAAGMLISIPVGLWIERERRRQPEAIFGARAARLQIDHLQHRLGRMLRDFVTVSVVVFLCQEALATGRFGRPFAAGAVYGPYWIIVGTSVFTAVRAAWSLSRRGWTPLTAHPYIALALRDERVQVARVEALRRAYPAMVAAAASAYGVSAIAPDLTRYALPAVLLVAVALPALLWRAALRNGGGEDAS